MIALRATGAETARSRQMIRLRDGRTLAFAEWGDPAGRPVVMFHGTPGTRLTRPSDETPLHTRGVRLLTMDRPGYGLSDPHPGRRLLDWPADVAALADALGLEHFPIVGVSGGGPHALACAAALPTRVAAVALVGGPAPMDQPGVQTDMLRINRLAVRLADRLPAWTAAWPTRLGSRVMHRYPLLTMRVIAAPAAAPDRAALTSPLGVAESIQTIEEAFRRGTRGLIDDISVLSHPWGFAPADIRVPVYLWQGMLDRNVPVGSGRYLADSIPTCRRSVFCSTEGHELLHTHWPEILDALMTEG
jgi:pimeloyl-ACP methyl ester carboxylesterase